MLATCHACPRPEPDLSTPPDVTDVIVGRSPRRGRDNLAEAGLLERPGLWLFLR